MCQINTITGNIPYNLQLIRQKMKEAVDKGAELAVFPEMAITGYPPKDLLDYEGFVQLAEQGACQLLTYARELRLNVIVGTVTRVEGNHGKKGLYNSAAFLGMGHSPHPVFIHKKLLPTYDVFDEGRYFAPARQWIKPTVLDFGDLKIGVSICEDIWNDNEFWKNERRYEVDPIDDLIKAGANYLINISASPFTEGKPEKRIKMLHHTARRYNTPVMYVNQVGGCDQIIFDGGSAVITPNGLVRTSCGWFKECVAVHCTDDTDSTAMSQEDVLHWAPEGTLIEALCIGLRDYMAKTGFRQVVVGNSGGIDSALTLVLAAKALGNGNVFSITMPGPYTSKETQRDADDLAANLGIKHWTIPIGNFCEEMKRATLGSNTLGDWLIQRDGDYCPVADENMQARFRGQILMWFSNASRQPMLVLSTGNKSETAVGYCTLYGDTCGGLALISDLPKMKVYALAKFINQKSSSTVIPQSIIDREPSAELAPNQKDTDSLPPYPVLDEIIRLYIEEMRNVDQITKHLPTVDPHTIERVIRLVNNAEYKRNQMPPGLKVTSKAFGFGRRMPIARGM